MVVRKIMSMIVQMIMRTCLMVTVFRNNEEKSILEFCAAIKMTAENSLRKERITYYMSLVYQKHIIVW